MKTFMAAALAAGLVLAVSLATAAPAATQSKPADDRIGLVEDCSTTAGWYEWDANDKEVPPRVKMESGDGKLLIHTNRGLLFASRWGVEGVTKSSILRKNYGLVDMDKYHYMVVNVESKGSSTLFGINGFDTKCGYTTGLTVVDLKDYDVADIHGKRNVRLELDLHDNLTTLVINEIKLVSALTEEEQKALIGGGLAIRDEKLHARDFHDLKELKRRAGTPLPAPAGEEMAIFRDTATGAISTRLTCGVGDNFLGEGDIWSGDGAAISFDTKGRKLPGPAVLYMSDGEIVSAGDKMCLNLWSPVDRDKLFLVSGNKGSYTVSAWDYKTRTVEPVAAFTVPQVGEYTEVKRFTDSGKLIVAFRETPYFVLVDPKAKKADVYTLSTRLKDASMSPDEQFILFNNCYTYESRWHNVKTGVEGLASTYAGSHASHGLAGTVAGFNSTLMIFIPPTVFNTTTADGKVTIWANWSNDVPTDYGSLTGDNQWIFTNGAGGDVANQHVTAPTDDSGAVLRLARYFTKFSWTSPTYSRPSPDYTKLIYCDNCLGPTQLVMVYTRRTDSPENVAIKDSVLSWSAPKRSAEIAGYNVYQSGISGRNFVKINDKPITGTSYKLPGFSGMTGGFFTVTAVEHSKLESMMSGEVAADGPGRTFYFEAERLKLTPPARRFYDGFCNDFQCVRINAESAAEKAADGTITLDTKPLPAGKYAVWALASGKGAWTVNGKATAIDSRDFKWVRLAEAFETGAGKTLAVTSGDDSLKLDTLMLTAETFVPSAADPRDTTPPDRVEGLQADAATDKGAVKLTWKPSEAPDLHHYSVFAGGSMDFPCDNTSLIRSTYKNSITDAGMEKGAKLYYKVVAYDNRWNASPPAVVSVEFKPAGETTKPAGAPE